MATTAEKATPFCIDSKSVSPAVAAAAASASASDVLQDWSVATTDQRDDQQLKRSAMATLIRPVDSLTEPPINASTKGIQIMMRAQTSHPLDPLSAAEISVAVATVRAAGATPEVRDSMRFVEVVLLEPDKHVVALADAYFFPPFQPSLLPKTKGGPVIPSKLPPRRARLVVYNKGSNETSISIVELSEVHAATRGGHHRGKVITSQVVPDVQPPMDAMEYAECEAVVKDFPPFREAMKKRGIEDMDLVMVDAWCVGYHSDADAPSRRLAKPLIFCRTESDCPVENGYARPVEGIYILVDMQNMVVVEFEDRKLVPLPPADPLRNYSPGETRGGVDRSDVKPLQIIQPEGPSFRVHGHFVQWQKWNFRIGFTPREGLVIYSVAYIDGSRGRRPVAHRLSFVEMVVPYGDPNEPHYRKNAFDAGEDGLGKNAHSLKKGCDCLGYIKYFDAHFTNFTGGVETIENCVCLHEEDHGILWKHQDWRTGLAEVRRSRRLTDGKIEAEVKLTGILSLGALQPGEFRKYGTTIAPGLYAPVHQHFFVARMDMAVDCKPGETFNQVVEVDVKIEEPGKNNVHNNAFYAEEKLLRSEMQAMRDCNPLSARHWIVRHSYLDVVAVPGCLLGLAGPVGSLFVVCDPEIRNTRTVNRTGQLTGYKLVPGSNCLPLAGSEAKFLRRAAFLKHNLWVTPYARDEIYPGGEFPNQNPRIGEGLATWVKQNRPLEETDIVLWYVFGITHIPRLEDWPAMPVDRIGFMLMPHGFFNCSPAVDVPPNASELDLKDNGVVRSIELEPPFPGLTLSLLVSLAAPQLNQEKIKEEAVFFFKDLLDPLAVRPYVDSLSKPIQVLHEFQRGPLDCDVDKDEIKSGLFNIDSDSAPSLDGFTSHFLKEEKSIEAELWIPITLSERIRKAIGEAKSFKSECSEMGKQVDRLSQMLRSVARLATTSSLYERPIRCIAFDVSKNLERALTLIRKCKHSSFFYRVVSITSTADFRKLSNLLDSSIGDLKWLLSVFDSHGTVGGIVLSLPPIASNDPILSWVWSFVASIQMGQLPDRMEAANELASLALDNDRNKKIIVEEGGVPPLLKLLKERESPNAQIAAAIGLSNLANDQERVRLIVSEFGVPLIVQVLGDSPISVQIWVANLVSRMAEHDPVAQEEFARVNTIRPLVSLLSLDTFLDAPKPQSGKPSIDSLVQINKDLGRISLTKTDHSHYTKSSSFMHLEGTSRGGHHRKERENEKPGVKLELKIRCAEALWMLSRGNVLNSRRITETKGLLCLAKLIGEEQGELQLNCMMIVMEITAAAEFNADLRWAAFKTNSPAAKAVVDQLLRVIKEESDPSLQIPAIKSIGSLARTFPARETRVIGVLVIQLSHRNPDVAEEAAIALEKFACPENFLCMEHSRAIIKFDGVLPLMRLLRASERAQLHGLILLCYLALNAGNDEVLEQARVLIALEGAVRTVAAQHPALRELIPRAMYQLGLYHAGIHPH
ncbi:hypothetical protein HHK36_025013 [Tetracentron sinense]|uniref:Amine oxidase n=1 Tax=Tetracentron sinense TaxID=13715 RepID=A0A834YR24_TETSI|nr:hypothetical protein HHK36_025013 [Tetracentron sinense]